MRLLATAFFGAAALLSAAVAHAKPSTAHYARGDKALVWFVQITDLHLGSPSITGPYAPEHLTFALSEAVPTIGPSFVVATGDLAHGSLNGIPYFGQDPADWALYRQIVSQAGMTPSFYFDLPGNHDGYGDIGLTSYLANSVQGQVHNRPYFSWERTDALGGRYVFIGLNSAGQGSPALSAQQPAFTADEISWLGQQLENAADANLVVVFAHHPIDEPPGGDEVAALLEAHGGAFYLHGHQHAYAEYIVSTPLVVSNQLGSLGQGNDHNIGVGVIDHNAFVFRATSTSEPWPLVIITAPVSATLRRSEVPNPWRYSVCKNRVDNPIRALVFSPELPSEVTASAGGLDPVALSLAPGSTSLWQGVLDTTSLPSGDLPLSVTARFGAATHTDSIQVRFASGDCEPLPDDDVGSGGAGGAAGGGGAGAGATGGSGGAGAGPPVTPLATATPEDKGCGCRLVGTRGKGPRTALVSLIAALALARRSRRRRA